MNRDDIIAGFVEIEPLDRANFLKVKETLTRIGLPGKDRTLQQVCYVLHKKGRYYIVSHLELFKLDGRDIDITEQDRVYRNAVVDLLEQWSGLGVRVVRNKEAPVDTEARVKVIHFNEKPKWTLVSPYQIGKRLP